MEEINKKILIVEDDKEFLWLLKQSFAGAGFKVVTALDGEEGLRVTKEEKPDLIILDILMPKMDGIEMAKKLKGEGDKTQIIFLTNVKDADYISRAIEFDTPDYIVKSDIHIDDIIARVKNRLGIL